jgi:putative thiamine transport system permease protein
MAEALQPVMSLRALLRFFPPLTVVLFAGPVIVGVCGTLLPAFGYLPAAGGAHLSLDPWRALFADPSLLHALRRSIGSGFAASLLALLLAFVIAAAWHGTAAQARVQRALLPVLGIPHAAFAIGFGLLIAPSGWLVRIVAIVTGAAQPPDIALVQDPWCVALTIALVCKETPFLLLMVSAALPQLPADRILAVTRTLGYGRIAGWFFGLAPLVYRQIRLPVLAVLVYSLSVVDVAIVLGPTNPPTFAVVLLTWFQAPDARLKAAAGAMLLTVLVVLSIACWFILESGAARLFSHLTQSGVRRRRERGIVFLAVGGAGGLVAVTMLAPVLLLVWSMAAEWPFPHVLPYGPSPEVWRNYRPEIIDALANTIVIAIASTIIGLILVIGCLENEVYRGASGRALSLIYTPLLVPQVGFLFGLQIVFVLADLDATMAAVIAAHLAFVVPYLFLTLGDPYRHLDPRYARIAATLGASPWRILWRIRLPLLGRAIAVATAVGFSVSVGQYLATLLPGAGRIETVTTAAVALSSGGDRRVTAAFATAQTLLPLMAFAAAVLCTRRRRS